MLGRRPRAGGRATPSTAARPLRFSPLDAAYETLWPRPEAPVWAAEAVYRAVQKKLHPDASGSHEDAVAANAAIALICSSADQRLRAS